MFSLTAVHFSRQRKKTAHRLMAMHSLFVCVCGRGNGGRGTGVYLRREKENAANNLTITDGVPYC